MFGHSKYYIFAYYVLLFITHYFKLVIYCKCYNFRFQFLAVLIET